MEQRETRYTFDRVVRMTFSAAALVGVLVLLRYLSTVLIPFAIAVVLAYLLNPLVNAFEAKTKRRWLAVALTLGGIGVVGLGLTTAAITLSVGQVEQFNKVLHSLRADIAASFLATDQARTQAISEDSTTAKESTSVRTEARGSQQPKARSKPDESIDEASAEVDAVEGEESAVAGTADPDRTIFGLRELADGWAIFRASEDKRAVRFRVLLDSVNGTIMGTLLQKTTRYLGSDDFDELLFDTFKRLAAGGWSVVTFTINLVLGLVGLIIVLLYLVFLLLDFPEYARNWKSFLPPNYREPIVDFLAAFDVSLRRYFRGQATVAICMGILFSIGFSLIDLPMAVPLGLFVGLLNMVPYLQTVGLVPALILSILKAVEGNSSLTASIMLTLLVFAVAQVIQDALITPRFMSRATGLRPVAILLGVFVWGKLLGFLGLVLAIPLTCLGIAYYQRHILQHPPEVIEPKALPSS